MKKLVFINQNNADNTEVLEHPDEKDICIIDNEFSIADLYMDCGESCKEPIIINEDIKKTSSLPPEVNVSVIRENSDILIFSKDSCNVREEASLYGAQGIFRCISDAPDEVIFDSHEFDGREIRVEIVTYEDGIIGQTKTSIGEDCFTVKNSKVCFNPEDVVSIDNLPQNAMIHINIYLQNKYLSLFDKMLYSYEF